MADIDAALLDQLDAAVSTLRLTARITNARVAQVDAALAALLPASAPAVVYQRCLFCNSKYGCPNDTYSYEIVRAACGCEGVGQRCVDGIPDAGDFKSSGCNTRAKPTLPKCYACNQRDLADYKISGGEPNVSGGRGVTFAFRFHDSK